MELTNDPASMADPFPEYDRLRAAGPVYRASTPTGEEVWVVTRYADARPVLADPRFAFDKANSTSGYRGFALPPALDANLLNMDDPGHARVRRLVSAAFTVRRARRLQPTIEAVVAGLIDAVAPAGKADLIADLALPLPLTVIGELLGVPAGDRAAFRAWTSDLIAPPSRAAAQSAVVNMEHLLRSLIAAKRSAPADDLISAMIAARDDRDQLTEDELTSLAFLVLWAGYEVTVDLLGAGILALLDHPDQLDLLRADPEAAAGAVDELLRWTAPSPYAIRRFPREDVTVGGVRIPAGATVLVSLASAHRDPAQFPDPGVLDLRRANAATHLGFGFGAHYCLGAPLARLEVAAALRTVAVRLPELRLDVPADALRWRPSFRARGLLALPVTFRPA